MIRSFAARGGSMKTSKLGFSLSLALACAFNFCLVLSTQAQNVSFETLAHFHGHGASVNSLVQGPDGNFYGAGGYPGQVVRMTPAGQLTTIYRFCSLANCADGSAPHSPILGSDGNLYGTTIAGGSSHVGVVYRMTLDGEETILHDFCSSCAGEDGPNPIIQASDGNFYGTTFLGGEFDDGSLFRITPTGEFTVLHQFCSQQNCIDGSLPEDVIQGIDGNLYGATYNGGSHASGAIYKMTLSGSYEVIYNSCEFCSDGASPSNIVQDANGNFFGVTQASAPNLFELTSTGEYIVLNTFHGDTGWPFAGVLVGIDGNLYGTLPGSVGYGSGDSGSVFSFTSSGQYTTLHTFFCCGNQLYSNEVERLPIQATDGSFYGTTAFGPGSDVPGPGTIYRLSVGLGPLVETVPTGGKVGSTILILGNNLTGTTSVTFNGVPASFTVESDTYIKATVPAGAATGVVSVLMPSGTLNSNPQFAVTK